MPELQESDIAWEAPEHSHTEKGNDWYWAVGIIAVAGAAAAIMFGNVLFGIVIILGAATVIIASARVPKIVLHVVSTRGIRLGEQSYPYNQLESFCIDEENPQGPQLLLKSKRLLSPLLVVPIPEDAIDEIEYVLEGRLPAEHLEEPLGHKILEFFGF